MIMPDPSCASCSGREESTDKSQPGCKGATLCVKALPKNMPGLNTGAEGSRLSGGKGHPGTDFCS